MKTIHSRKERPITKPLLNDLVKGHHASFKRVVRIASTGSSNSPLVESTPVAPANLYQDAGGGYNSNLTFIQD
jgi:hypothetical protein